MMPAKLHVLCSATGGGAGVPVAEAIHSSGVAIHRRSSGDGHPKQASSPVPGARTASHHQVTCLIYSSQAVMIYGFSPSVPVTLQGCAGPSIGTEDQEPASYRKIPFPRRRVCLRTCRANPERHGFGWSEAGPVHTDSYLNPLGHCLPSHDPYIFSLSTLLLQGPRLISSGGTCARQQVLSNRNPSY